MILKFYKLGGHFLILHKIFLFLSSNNSFLEISIFRRLSPFNSEFNADQDDITLMIISFWEVTSMWATIKIFGDFYKKN